MEITYEKQARNYKRRVFHQGTAAIRKGEGCCYTRDWVDTGTGELATDAHGYRDKYVAVPSILNNNFFAGVAVQSYSANATGQWIEIYEPRSVCLILIGRDTVIGATRLTCSAAVADRGRFVEAGFNGRGTAKLLQTNTSGNLGESLDGTTTVSTATVTKTGLFTNAVVGDIVVIYGGTDSVPVPAEYVIATRTSADVAVLDSSPGDGNICCYVISGADDTEALAYLYDGEESGLVEWIDVASGAVATMVGGVSHICGGYTVASADGTFTLADASIGLKKGFILHGALGGNDYLVTLGTTGLRLDGATGWDSAEFDADGDIVFAEVRGSLWTTIEYAGPTLT